jgi:hypothetical protein
MEIAPARKVTLLAFGNPVFHFGPWSRTPFPPT